MTIKFNADLSFTELPQELYSTVQPEEFSDPSVQIWNDELATELGLSPKFQDQIVKILSKTNNSSANNSIAQAYAGHQFGHFSILGDGRATLLGEQLDQSGKRVDVQLKGSGRTPYSRRGDGKATLYSMLREYLISEAMNGLKIPTSRSLAVFNTGESVNRETVQAGGVLTRIAASHIRIGTFEFAARTIGKDAVKELADYSIQRHYPDLLADEFKNENIYVLLFKKVMEKQISTVVHWLRVGFIHGVMNTDNITISGETIDYGPCAFMNTYDPATVFSSIDTQKRYAFGNQGRILLWNLARFAETLLPLFEEDEEKAFLLGQQAIDSYEDLYLTEHLNMMRSKLGLLGDEQPEDKVLVEEFLSWMQENKADYTNSFLSLENEIEQEPTGIKFNLIDYNHNTVDKLNSFLKKWNKRIGLSNEASLTRMQEVNPRIIPRNNLVEIALNEAADSAEMNTFEKLLLHTRDPYNIGLDFSQFQLVSQQNDGYQTFCGT